MLNGRTKRKTRMTTTDPQEEIFRLDRSVNPGIIFYIPPPFSA